MMKKKESSFQKRILGLLGIVVVLAMLSATIAVAGERIGNDPIVKNTNTDIVIQSSGLVTNDLNSGLTPTDLVNTLLGGGVAVSNVTYNGTNFSAGNFSGGTGIIGFESGIILSSGNISSVVGPNTADGTTTVNGLPGDADLDLLIPGYQTYDATVLEFDFVPDSSGNITFEYVFGSEEYNEYVNTPFNDVFGFFLDGTNIALIPGTSTPVSINNVNGGNPLGTNPNNSAYYINNDLDDGGPFFDTELDGLTVVLNVTAAVNAGQKYHLKLAIADAGDYILDSDVFIKGASFTVVPKFSVTKDFRFTNVNFSATQAVLGELLPDADADGKFDVRYVLKPKDGTVSSTNPGQLYGVKTIEGLGVDTVHMVDTFGTQFDVNPAKRGGGVEILRIDAAGYATVLTGDLVQVPIVIVDNGVGTVNVGIYLASPLGADEKLMIYIKYQTALKDLQPQWYDFVNENEVTINDETPILASATIEFV